MTVDKIYIENDSRHLEKFINFGMFYFVYWLVYIHLFKVYTYPILSCHNSLNLTFISSLCIYCFKY